MFSCWYPTLRCALHNQSLAQTRETCSLQPQLCIRSRSLNTPGVKRQPVPNIDVKLVVHSQTGDEARHKNQTRSDRDSHTQRDGQLTSELAPTSKFRWTTPCKLSIHFTHRETQHQYTKTLSIHTARNVSAGNKQDTDTNTCIRDSQQFFGRTSKLNTQSLNFPLLTNATSSRLILRLLLWLLSLLSLPSSNNTTTIITDSTPGTTIHNKLVETETHQGEPHKYSSLPLGSSQT